MPFDGIEHLGTLVEAFAEVGTDLGMATFDIMVDGFGADSALATHIEIIVVGALIIIFLIAEPHGLARLWRIVKEKMTERLFQEALRELSAGQQPDGDASEQAYFSKALRTLTTPSPEPERADTEPTAGTSDAAPVEWTSLVEIDADAESTNDSSPEFHQDGAGGDEDNSNSENPGMTFSFQEESEPVDEVFLDLRSTTDTPSGDGSSRTVDANVAGSGLTNQSKTVYYVYGIVSSEHKDLVNSGFPKGMTDTSSVFIIDRGELSAIVSLEDALVFGGQSLDQQMKDTEWLKDKVRRHAGVLFEIRKDATLVPLRFGMTCASDEDVIELINEQQRHFGKMLDRLRGKSEFGVRMFCDTETLDGAISKTDKSVDATLEDMPRSVTRFIKGLAREDGTTRDMESAEDLRETCIRRAHGVLLEVSAEGTFKEIITQIDSEGRELIMNAAYLVPTYMEKQFEYSMERLATEYKDLGFTFEKSGPWPPFHFVGIDDDEDADFMTGIGE